MISFFFGGLYSIVDAFFVGRNVGDSGLAAINIAYPLVAVLQAVGTGIGVGIVAYLLLNLSLRYLEAGVVSLFGNLIPVFTLVFAYVILGERLNVPQVACVGLALAGVLVSSTEKKS